MSQNHLSVIYISPQFPSPRHGFELVELEELATRVRLHIVSLRKPSRAAWDWMTNRLSCRPGRDHTSLGPGKVITGAPALALKAFAGRDGGDLLRTAFRLDLKGGLKTAIGLMAGSYVGKVATACGADIIHADFASAPTTVAMSASQQSGIPFSFCGHAFDIFSTKPAGKASEPVLKEKARLAKAVFAANSSVLSRLQGLGTDKAKLFLKRNGVRGALRPPLASRGQDPFRVVGLGGLVEKKGFDILIEAVARVSNQGREVELVIYGEGPERALLEQLGQRRGMAVKLPGAYRHSDVDQILDSASVVVLPSRILRDKDSDGVPTVFLEALRCGVPIIGADVGSVGDIIRDGKTGWLVKSDSVDDLVRALVECMSDYPRACELCKQGQELLMTDFMAANSADVMVRAWTQMLDAR